MNPFYGNTLKKLVNTEKYTSGDVLMLNVRSYFFENALRKLKDFTGRVLKKSDECGKVIFEDCFKTAYKLLGMYIGNVLIE